MPEYMGRIINPRRRMLFIFFAVDFFGRRRRSGPFYGMPFFARRLQLQVMQFRHFVRL